MRAWSRGVVVAVAVLALAGGCTNRDDGGQGRSEFDLRVGLLAPLSGSGAGAGRDALRGAELAAELISDRTLTAGTDQFLPSGMRVTIVSGDTKDDVDRGIDNAARLIAEEDVAGLIGAGSPAVLAATSQRTERLGVPFIGADTAANFLTERGLSWFFRTGPTERTLASSLFSVLNRQAARDPSTRRVVIVHGGGGAANDLTAQLTQLADEGGFELDGAVRVDLESTDLLDPQHPENALSRVRASGAGSVFLVAPTAADARRLTALFAAEDEALSLIAFGGGFAEPAYLDEVGDDARGLLFAASWSRPVAERSETAEAILRAYEERHREPMSQAAANAFTAVQGLAEAASRARSNQPALVRTALVGLDLSGRSTVMPWDGIRFDATGQNVQAVGVVQQQLDGGNVRVVFPPGIADGAALPLAEAREPAAG